VSARIGRWVKCISADRNRFSPRFRRLTQPENGLGAGQPSTGLRSLGPEKGLFFLAKGAPAERRYGFAACGRLATSKPAAKGIAWVLPCGSSWVLSKARVVSGSEGGRPCSGGGVGILGNDIRCTVLYHLKLARLPAHLFVGNQSLMSALNSPRPPPERTGGREMQQSVGG